MSEETTETADSILEGVEVKSEETLVRREITFPRERFDEMMRWTLANGWQVRRIGPFHQEVDEEGNETGVNVNSAGDPAEMQVWVMEKPLPNTPDE